jgi:hypothetical protein
MSEELETTIHTKDGMRVSMSEWDNGGVWLYLSMRHGDARAIFTREEAQQLLAGLQTILAKGAAV